MIGRRTAGFLLGATLVGAAAIGLRAQANVEDQARRQLESGREFYRNGRYIEALKDFRLWLPTHWAFSYQQFLLQPIDLKPVAEALASGLAWVVVLGPVTAWWFHRKDIAG